LLSASASSHHSLPSAAFIINTAESDFRYTHRSVAIRIAGSTVEATLLEGEPMEMRIGAAAGKLTAGVTQQVSL
jgi:sarcosine oxidase gamma subunit